VQDHEGPVGGIESCQGALHEVPIGQVTRGVAYPRLDDGIEGDLAETTPAPTCLVEAAVHEEAVQPGVEPVRVTKPGQVPPGTHQGVLDRVAREVRVPKDETRGRVQTG